MIINVCGVIDDALIMKFFVFCSAGISFGMLLLLTPTWWNWWMVPSITRQLPSRRAAASSPRRRRHRRRRHPDHIELESLILFIIFCMYLLWKWKCHELHGYLPSRPGAAALPLWRPHHTAVNLATSSSNHGRWHKLPWFYMSLTLITPFCIA